MDSFVPLVFSTFGGMSGCTKHLAYLPSLKRDVSYSSVMAWLCCGTPVSAFSDCLSFKGSIQGRI